MFSGKTAEGEYSKSLNFRPFRNLVLLWQRLSREAGNGHVVHDYRDDVINYIKQDFMRMEKPTPSLIVVLSMYVMHLKMILGNKTETYKINQRDGSRTSRKINPAPSAIKNAAVPNTLITSKRS